MEMANLPSYLQAWFLPLAVLVAAVAAALIAHKIIFAVGKRTASRTGNVINNSLVRHAEGPTRWIFPLLAILIAMPALPVGADWVQALRRVVGLGVIAAFAWATVLLSDVMGDLLYSRYRMDIADNLAARRIRTQISVLQRIFTIVVIVVAASFMLMTFPGVRQLGASLLASAGLAGLVLGMAMKSTLSSLIAGLQIALTGPIHIEDVVIVEGEFGWIEEITTTYVVVRTWDLRRLIVPLSYFIEHVFQNWTRQTSDLLVYVYLYCDYTVPVEELRQEFRRILDASPLWDHKVCALQVSDASEQTIQIRALTSASDASKAWDLRCYVREHLIRFLQEKYPESLPRTRAEVSGKWGDGGPNERAQIAESHANSREPIPQI
jgi:small-conductance mechanosensitive channel